MSTPFGDETYKPKLRPVHNFLMPGLFGGGTPSGGSPAVTTLYPGIIDPLSTTSQLEALGYSAWPSYHPMTEPNPSLPGTWTSNTAGFYYVKAGGTNVGNGYPGDPRSTMPATLAAGDVMVIDGDVSDDGTLTASGTSGSPCWILNALDEGVAGASDGRFTGDTYTWAGTHLIIDNVGGYYTTGTGTVNSLTANYITIRNGTWHGDRIASRQGFAFSSNNHVMFYNNLVYDFGFWASPTDDNRHGIKISNATNWWIIDSIFHDITNDGVQVGDTNTPSTMLGFIGGCVGYNNAQTGFWGKNSYHVIVSSNEVYDHIDAPAGAGGYYMLGAQYDFANWWWINNKLHGTGGNMYIGSANGTQTAGARYFIQNLSYDTTNPTYNTTDSHSPAAITDRNSSNPLITVNNTLENIHAGISSPYSGRTIKGNTISAVTASGASQLFLIDNSGHTVDYNAYEGTAAIRFGSTTPTTFSALTGAGLEANGQENATLTYVNAAGGDYTPATGSDAIDTNTLDSVYATFEALYGFPIVVDLMGTTRPVGTWDRGAIEKP